MLFFFHFFSSILESACIKTRNKTGSMLSPCFTPMEHPWFVLLFPLYFGIFAWSLDDSRHVLRDSKFLEEFEEQQLGVCSVKGLDQVDMQRPRWQVVVPADL